MPEILRSRLDYSRPWSLPDIKLFTGNPIRRSDGALVMGRGAAQQVRDSWPRVQYDIKTNKPVTWYCINQEQRQWIGWFQVKHHWRDAARLDLITASTNHLSEMAARRPFFSFHLNAPGVGNGKLSWDDVEPILQVLPSNVTIYL